MYDIASFHPWQRSKDEDAKIMEQQYKQGDVWRKGKKSAGCICEG